MLVSVPLNYTPVPSGGEIGRTNVARIPGDISEDQVLNDPSDVGGVSAEGAVGLACASQKVDEEHLKGGRVSDVIESALGQNELCKDDFVYTPESVISVT